ncbi:uncharacterized protein Z518_04164 [Rhinocladiella mackenziei CBS 650.93]|uniref:Uncharacterized protein n=1 Tax=Rhinocladiella mackenziei CBS 650.93 TaxID=1442369 RepID=A0A0D2JAQ0_9EURO|nr:uncharacterized protein Z518_04164 [Rhinocladiella mackenziei CBS 650.93]KIX06190.1 hypothetical protein Z518_04164 [Rhinocladiella mackenziei CBS 650.93]
MDMRFAGPGPSWAALKLGWVHCMMVAEVNISPNRWGAAELSNIFCPPILVDAETAEHMGWPNKAFPSVEEMNSHVDKRAERIATFSTAILAATKDLVNEQTPAVEARDRDLAIQSPRGP